MRGLKITAFVAVLTMDANRQKAGRLSFFCCFKSKAFLEEVRYTVVGSYCMSHDVRVVLLFSDSKKIRRRMTQLKVYDCGMYGNEIRT